jgi:PIN domain nuclease of toxin-antitoxin system
LILLDTHVVVWLALDPGRISKKAHSAIDQARRENRGLAISDVTLMEVAHLSSRGRLHFQGGVEAFLSEVERRFVVLPITAHISVQAFALPSHYPKDPVDRIIGATALLEDIPLLTADGELRNSGAVPTIW